MIDLEKIKDKVEELYERRDLPIGGGSVARYEMFIYLCQSCRQLIEEVERLNLEVETLTAHINSDPLREENEKLKKVYEAGKVLLAIVMADGWNDDRAQTCVSNEYYNAMKGAAEAIQQYEGVKFEDELADQI